MAIATHAIEIARKLAIDVAVFGRFTAAARAITAGAILRAVERVFSHRANAVWHAARTTGQAKSSAWRWRARFIGLSVAIVVKIVSTRFRRWNDLSCTCAPLSALAELRSTVTNANVFRVCRTCITILHGTIGANRRAPFVGLSVAVVVDLISTHFSGRRRQRCARLRLAIHAILRRDSARAHAARRRAQTVVSLSVAIVVDTIACFRLGGQWRTRLRLAIDTIRHGRRACADTATRRSESFIDLSVAIIVQAVAYFLTGRFINETIAIVIDKIVRDFLLGEDFANTGAPLLRRETELFARVTSTHVFCPRGSGVRTSLRIRWRTQRTIQSFIGLSVAIVILAIALLGGRQHRANAFGIKPTTVEFTRSSAAATNAHARGTCRSAITILRFEGQTRATQAFVVLPVAIVVDVVANLVGRGTRTRGRADAVGRKRKRIMRGVGQTQALVKILDAHHAATWRLHQVIRNDFESHRSRLGMDQGCALRGNARRRIKLRRQFGGTRGQRRAAALKPIDIDWISIGVFERNTNGLRIAIRRPLVRRESHPRLKLGRVVQNKPNIASAFGVALALTNEANFRRRSVNNDHVIVISRATRFRRASIAIQRLRNDVVTSRIEDDEDVEKHVPALHTHRLVDRLGIRRNRLAVATHAFNDEVDTGHVIARIDREFRTGELRCTAGSTNTASTSIEDNASKSAGASGVSDAARAACASSLGGASGRCGSGVFRRFVITTGQKLRGAKSQRDQRIASMVSQENTSQARARVSSRRGPRKAGYAMAVPTRKCRKKRD